LDVDRIANLILESVSEKENTEEQKVPMLENPLLSTLFQLKVVKNTIETIQQEKKHRPSSKFPSSFPFKQKMHKAKSISSIHMKKSPFHGNQLLPSLKPNYYTNSLRWDQKRTMRSNKNTMTEWNLSNCRNRMGQRARRQLWESIYGSAAKHLKSKKDQSSLAKRFSQSSSNRNRKEATDAPLHPSWKAKRQEREQTTIKQFSGTKTVFDDQ
jgi:hypothetical protein